MVLTGTEIIGLLLARSDPNTDNGTEITNQITTIANIVPMGMAPEELTYIKKKFKNMKIPKRTPGTKRGVRIMFIFQFSPPKNL